MVDVLRGVQAPHDPEVVAQDFAKLARGYGCVTVRGDRYSGEWVSQAFSKAGVRYEVSDMTKSEIYLENVAHFATGKVRLPNNDRLIRELRLLERRVGRSGKDACDHPRNGCDDYANAACGVIDLCQRVPQGRTLVGAIDPDGFIHWRESEPEQPLRVRTVTLTEAEAAEQGMKFAAPNECFFRPFKRASR